MISNIFHLILYQPLFNILIWLYNCFPWQDFGVVVIVLTIGIRFLLYPLMAQSIRSQKRLNELQPQIKEIQKKYEKNQEALAKATMELYQKEKFNPFSGCLPLLIQLPILFALYRVFWYGLKPDQMDNLYSFVTNPGTINASFLGLIDLSSPNIILAFLAGIFQFVQSKMVAPKNQVSDKKDPTSQMTQMMQKQMIYFLPLFTVFVLWNLPSAIGLYG
jgi:YidC/Oxa1 family membrane protein insertase